MSSKSGSCSKSSDRNVLLTTSQALDVIDSQLDEDSASDASMSDEERIEFDDSDNDPDWAGSTHDSDDSDSAESAESESEVEAEPEIEAEVREESNASQEEDLLPFIRGRDESKKGANDGQKWFLQPLPRTSRTTRENIFVVPTNKTPNSRGKDTPAEIFDLFLDEKMKKDIVQYTNDEGHLKKGELYSLFL